MLPIELCLYIEKWKSKLELHDRLINAQTHLENHFIRFPDDFVVDSWDFFVNTFREDGINARFIKKRYKTKGGKLITIRTTEFDHMTPVIEILIKPSNFITSLIDQNKFQKTNDVVFGNIIKEGYCLIFTVIFLLNFYKCK